MSAAVPCRILDQASLRGLRVGVTVHPGAVEEALWENGITQNALFLLMLLERLPLVDACCLVVGDDLGAARAAHLPGANRRRVLTLREAMNALDVVIELGAQLEPAWGRDFTARHGRIIAMRVANDLIIDAERMAFGMPPAMLMSGVPYSEIWTLPAFEASCSAYYKTGLRAPVRVMQHLWSPVFLAERQARSGALFDYQPGGRPWSVAVLEPNLCSVKTCHVPVLACDAAYRRAPSAFDVLRIYNGASLPGWSAFSDFLGGLDLTRDGRMRLEERRPLTDILGPLAQCVVSHHWHNGQNYLHYETLHGGFPLIHNSLHLDGCGYFYGDFDPEDGAEALLRAVADHDDDLASYRARTRHFLRGLDPCHEPNLRLYTEALAELFPVRGTV